MPKVRQLHWHFWDDEDVTLLSFPERLLMACMITTCADDYGRLEAAPRLLKKAAFAFDEGISVADVRAMRDRIVEQCHNVYLYEDEGQEYIQLLSFQKYQDIRYRVKSLIPSPPGSPQPQPGYVRKGEPPTDPDNVSQDTPDSQELPQVSENRNNLQQLTVEKSRVEKSRVELSREEDRSRREGIVGGSAASADSLGGLTRNAGTNGSMSGPLRAYLENFPHANPQRRRDIDKMVGDVGEEIALAAIEWGARNDQPNTGSIWECARKMQKEGIGRKPATPSPPQPEYENPTAHFRNLGIITGGKG